MKTEWKYHLTRAHLFFLLYIFSCRTAALLQPITQNARSFVHPAPLHSSLWKYPNVMVMTYSLSVMPQRRFSLDRTEGKSRLDSTHTHPAPIEINL